MAKREMPTVRGFYCRPDGQAVPWESLSYEERLEINKGWIERLERVMPEQYSKNPEEFKGVPDATQKEREEYFKLFPQKRNCRKPAANT